MGEVVSDSNIVSLKSAREAKARPDSRKLEILRALARITRHWRESGASSKEIAQALRIAARDLDADGQSPA
jgi:hypothetical protein